MRKSSNTFTTYKTSKSFEVKEAKPFSLRAFEISPMKRNTSIRIYAHSGDIAKPISPNEKDWIGIYKVGDSNAWKNVKGWVWAKTLAGEYEYSDGSEGDDKDEETEIKVGNLEPGEYEARYFLNNSFTSFKKSSNTIKIVD